MHLACFRRNGPLTNKGKVIIERSPMVEVSDFLCGMMSMQCYQGISPCGPETPTLDKWLHAKVTMLMTGVVSCSVVVIVKAWLNGRWFVVSNLESGRKLHYNGVAD